MIRRLKFKKISKFTNFKAIQLVIAVSILSNDTKKLNQLYCQFSNLNKILWANKNRKNITILTNYSLYNMIF